MEIIAYIHTDLPEKFGVPRQSNLAPDLEGTIVFEPEYRNPEAIRGIEGFDYLWLLWQFQGVEKEHWSATVRPPKLGGNTRMGVFATRSPFRPNPIGLSSVRLKNVEYTEDGPVLHVSGIDLKDMTPIYDIKPYLPYVDAHPQARGGFTEQTAGIGIPVEFSEELLAVIPKEKREGLLQILAMDPRPGYHKDPERVYGIAYAGYNIKFSVTEEKLIVTACDRRETDSEQS